MILLDARAFIRIIGNSQVGGGRLIEAMVFGPSKKCQKVKKTIGFVNLTDVLCTHGVVLAGTTVLDVCIRIIYMFGRVHFSLE